MRIIMSPKFTVFNTFILQNWCHMTRISAFSCEIISPATVAKSTVFNIISYRNVLTTVLTYFHHDSINLQSISNRHALKLFFNLSASDIKKKPCSLLSSWCTSMTYSLSSIQSLWAHHHVVGLQFMFLAWTSQACPLLFILFLCLFLSLWPFPLYFFP